MSILGPMIAVAHADFRERTRRESFLVSLVLVAWLAYAVAAGQIALRLGPYQGVMNAAWLGGLLTLVVNTLLGWMGFFLVNNAIDLDRRTGVGAVLAASPISRMQYVTVKWLSSFAMLAVLVGTLLLASVVLHWRDMQGLSLDLPDLVAPIVMIAVPMIAVTAACGVLFESVPFLRGGAGNVLWLVGFACLIAVSTRHAGADIAGFKLLGSSMAQAAKAQLPSYGGGFALQILPHQPLQGLFRWDGVDWSPGIVLHRTAWLVAAVPEVLLAAACFDRFDTGVVTSGSQHQPAQPPTLADSEADLRYPPAAALRAPVRRFWGSGFILVCRGARLGCGQLLRRPGEHAGPPGGRLDLARVAPVTDRLQGIAGGNGRDGVRLPPSRPAAAAGSVGRGLPGGRAPGSRCAAAGHRPG